MARSSSPKASQKKVCPGTGEKWAVADGTPVCPGCERSPGAIGADAPTKRGRGYAGTVPQHFLSEVPPEAVKAAQSRASRSPDPVRQPARSAAPDRFTIIDLPSGKFAVHDAETGDLTGLIAGYATKERAERKVQELLGSIATVGNGKAASTATSPAPPARTAKAAPAKPARSAPAKAAKAPAKPKAAKADEDEPSEPNGKAQKQAAKRSLAVGALQAVAVYFRDLPDGPIFAAMDEDEAAMTLSNWMHHWPVGETWPSDILPVPDRSNWR